MQTNIILNELILNFGIKDITKEAQKYRVIVKYILRNDTEFVLTFAFVAR